MLLILATVQDETDDQQKALSNITFLKIYFTDLHCLRGKMLFNSSFLLLFTSALISNHRFEIEEAH